MQLLFFCKRRLVVFVCDLVVWLFIDAFTFMFVTLPGPLFFEIDGLSFLFVTLLGVFFVKKCTIRILYSATETLFAHI